MSSEGQLLEYGSFAWISSSQHASNLYNAGSKLWTKADLRDIEQQLAQSLERTYFTVRSIDGTQIRIKNPMFGELSPIWKPQVDYQHYWKLVKSNPEGPPEEYRCSYMIHWNNVSGLRFRDMIENPTAIFEKNRLAWRESISCNLLKSRLKDILNTHLVTKVACFGLGDMCLKPSEWWIQNLGLNEDDPDDSFVRPRVVQHSIALTIAELCRESAANDVRLLAQDPAYTEESKGVLQEVGFSIVGEFGAGGFAEIDDNTVVFSVALGVPLKQIIADIARPVLIITSGFHVFNQYDKPWGDADSPRTKMMWDEYDRFEFPVSSEDGDLMTKLRTTYLYVRKAGGMTNGGG